MVFRFKEQLTPKKFILAVILATLTLLLLCSPFWIGRLLPSPLLRTAPVAIRCIENGQLFIWVSNRTDLPLMICFSGVETGADSSWTNFYQSGGLRVLRFSEEIGKPAELLGPHQSEEALGLSVPLPQLGQWRVKAEVLTKESRAEKIKFQIAFYLRRWRILRSDFDSNMVPLVTSPPVDALLSAIGHVA